MGKDTNQIEEENIKAAVKVMLSQPWLIFFLLLPSLINLLIFTGSQFIAKYSIVLSILFVAITPLVYVAYLEKLRDGQFSFPGILNAHLLNYLITTFIMVIPIFLLTFFQNIFGPLYPYLWFIFSFIIHLATIYVLPILFTTRSVRDALFGGVFYIFSQYKSNYDLLIVSAISLLISILASWKVYILFSGHLTLAILTAVFMRCISVFLNCTIFIAACIRLKNLSDRSRK